MTTENRRVAKILILHCLISICGFWNCLPSTLKEEEAAEALHKMGCKLEFNFQGDALAVKRVEAFSPIHGLFDRLQDLCCLKSLEIGGIPIATERAYLQPLVSLSNLNDLTLVGEFFDDNAMLHLNGLINLTSLKLIDTRLGEEGLHVLSKLTKLEHLELVNYTMVTRRGGEAISKLQSLRYLRLGGRWETNALLALKDIPALTSVSIGGPDVNGNLAQLKNISTLEGVNIVDATIDKTTIMHLRDMKMLRFVSLECCVMQKGSFENISRLRLRKLSFIGMPNPSDELTNAIKGYSVWDLHLRH